MQPVGMGVLNAGKPILPIVSSGNLRELLPIYFEIFTTKMSYFGVDPNDIVAINAKNVKLHRI